MIYEKGKLKNIAFPIGGIGTGCISLRGNGELVDWEIFNRPNKNTRNGYSHFAVRAKTADKTVVKALHGDTLQNLTGEHFDGKYAGFGFGPASGSMAGYPHFEKVRFDGKFPIAKLTFSDRDFPAKMRLTAFNPFIPHDEFSSGLPAAFFEIETENLSSSAVEYAIAFSVQNPTNASKNQEIEKSGVFGYNEEAGKDEAEYRDICALTDAERSSVQAYWYRGGWQDAPSVFWRDFSEKDTPTERVYDEKGDFDHFSVYAYFTLQPKEKKKTRFVLAWNMPNCYNYWSYHRDENGKDITWKNYYATQFETSKETAEYCLRNFETLLKRTKKFQDALYGSSLSASAIDAVASNLAVLKSPTVLRLEDGTFWGWEGVHETEGSCEGTCQHVWNYAYALPFLFPNLERSVREATLKYGLFDDGMTLFRIPLPLGRKAAKWRACVDGQMGEVIKCYREWKICGDRAWLAAHWEKIKEMLEYAWSAENFDGWDKNKDGVLEGRQHHTLDMELFGPSSWLQGFYLLALYCAAEMAEEMGERGKAEEYRAVYENGKKWTNENLFNGEYFCQKVDLKDKSVVDAFGAANYWNDEAKEIKYQIGEGSIIDQMLADWHADILAVPGVFDREKKRTALKNMFRYNYQPSMRKVTNMWRNFSLNDEAGTIICAYPDGVKKPVLPIPYCEETMTGFEYALAGLMVGEGLLEEGETLVKAVRDRFNGENRNPWNEFECGSNYARSMASFALLLLYSGFTFDMSKNKIGFYPKKFGSYFWSVGNSWGSVRLNGKTAELTVYGEPLKLRAFAVLNGEKAKSVEIDGKTVAFFVENGEIVFEKQAIKKKLSVVL